MALDRNIGIRIKQKELTNKFMISLNRKNRLVSHDLFKNILAL